VENMNIVFTAKISERHQKALQEQFPQVTFSFFASQKEAGASLNEADVLVTYGEDLTEEKLREYANLKWIQVVTAGVDKLPLPYLAESSILLTNVRGIHQIPMAEYTFAAMLQVARSLNEIYQNQLQKTWDARVRVDELYGKTLGIIGVGAIGGEIAKRAQLFGMNVLGVTRSGKEHPYCEKMFTPEQLDHFLPLCDYIVVVVPSTKETFRLIGEKELNLMKPTAVFINIARGTVVDEEALANHLKERKIKAAVLDVFTREPLAETSPLWELDNCIITPHVSGRSPRYMERALVVFRENLEQYLNGNEREMKNIVDCIKGY